MTKVISKEVYNKLFNIKELDIECLYINKHSTERYSVLIDKNPKVLARTVLQVEKNSLAINQIRLVVNQGNYHHCIMNLYQHKSTNKFYCKVLTVLSKKQFELSRNLNCGKLEKERYQLNIKDIVQDEVFFDYNNFIDYLN